MWNGLGWEGILLLFVISFLGVWVIEENNFLSKLGLSVFEG